MVSEADDKDALLLRLDRGHGLNFRLSQVWISSGGIAANGMKYAPPSTGVAWGNRGCPLVSRDVREHHKDVNLPEGLQGVFGVSLTVDQLDSHVFERLPSDVVWHPPPLEFRDFLYGMPIQASHVAIPAGMPLTWIEELPITGRTRAAVQRAFREAGEDNYLRVPMLASQFLRVHSVGATALNELACVIESAELGRTAETATVEALQSVDRLAAFNRHLFQFARWAMAETDAQNLGEAIAMLVQTAPTNEAWKPVASIHLTDLAEPPSHPYEVLDEWLKQKNPRWQAIFLARLARKGDSVSTLEELGKRFGVTRERIRQIEARSRRSLARFIASDAALPLRWRAATLRRSLGVAAPLGVVEHLLRAPAGCNDYSGILLEIAGPYDRNHDWLTLRSKGSDDPTSRILARADEVGRIDREFATSQLTEWGLDASLHERWLTPRWLCTSLQWSDRQVGHLHP